MPSVNQKVSEISSKMRKYMSYFQLLAHLSNVWVKPMLWLVYGTNSMSNKKAPNSFQEHIIINNLLMMQVALICDFSSKELFFIAFVKQNCLIHLLFKVKKMVLDHINRVYVLWCCR